MVGIMICCMDDFLIVMLEGRELGFFVGSFDGTGDDVGGPFVGLVVGGGMASSEIDSM